MAESKMPARIWAGNPHFWLKPYDAPDGVRELYAEYIRADIVERMAEALERAEELYQVGLLKAKDGLADQVVALRRSAINSYHEASNVES